MQRPSPKQVALAAGSVADDARQLAHARAARLEDHLDSARESVSSRLRPRPRHRLRNALLGLGGAALALAVSVGLIGRRKSSAPSPVQRAGTAAKEVLDSENGHGAGATDFVAAGVAAAKTGVAAVEEDVAVGAKAVKDAPPEAVHEKADAAKGKLEAVKQNVAGKLVRVAVIAAVGLTAYILLMSVLVALLVKWIV